MRTKRMSASTSLLIHCIFIFHFSFCFASSSFSSSIKAHKCSTKQTHALLLFKQSLSSTTDSSIWFGSDDNPIMMNWNITTDCCKWAGVTCRVSTGDVIGLDLSNGMLQGTIHPNTSLFDLPYLEKLNLASNDFTASQLPNEIGKLSGSLTHLNISGCGFMGQVPKDITLLHKLVSLDLSWSAFEFDVGPHVFNNMFKNFTFLEELVLQGVVISPVLPNYLNISSSLRVLDLRNTGLQGNLPYNIFDRQFLKKIDLSFNSLIGKIPWEISKLPNLVNLDLSMNENLRMKPDIFISFLENSTLLSEVSLADVNIGSVLPTHLNTSGLKSLDLRNTSLRGRLPDNIFNLQHLEQLFLLGNNNLTGPLPIVNMSTSIPLKWLDMSNTNLSGEIPDSIGHLESLSHLIFSDCNLIGSLPKTPFKLTNLISLDLSNNKLSGSLPSWLFTLPSLESIYLVGNMFSGTIPLELFSLQSLKELKLAHNQLDGQIDVLDQGPILQTFRQLTNLTVLDLSFNSFRGDWELDTLLLSLINLVDLDLSYSGLSVTTNDATRYVNPYFNTLILASCNIKVFPESLRAMKNLLFLNLSNNDMHGHIPDWAGKIGGSMLLTWDISNNFITSLPQLHWTTLHNLHIQSNKIQGPFPSAICNMNQLRYCDMSNNNFSGVIPQCVKNIIPSLVMLNLNNNRFNGTLPNVYDDCEELEGLIFNGNQLEGEVPNSLTNCQTLKILDFGNNLFNSTFPGWLGDLPNLQALVLKSNNFHGPIVTTSKVKSPFPLLRVLDLSHNGFFGPLPREYFRNFNAMKNVVKRDTKLEYLQIGRVYYSIVLVAKGGKRAFAQIVIDYTVLDLSYNNFQGEIPDIIGSLDSLIVLDLSHNNLTGRIPLTLGNLTEIESLDLSSNQLTSEIPQGLTDLTFLSFLNLSQNNLVGRIPQGKQFNTFDGNSFGGNPKLCGLPLPKKCGDDPHKPHIEEDVNDDEKDDGFTWKAVVLGYGSGTLLGLVIGYIMLSTRRPKWFIEIADAVEHMILSK
ncbi:hypothetical protein R6Q59_014379 [Mikania micrantha]